MSTYTSAQKSYFKFCHKYSLTAFPMSERQACLYVAYLAEKGLRTRSISVYLAALRHLRVSCGEAPGERSAWPRLQYVLKGVKRTQAVDTPIRRRLPITIGIMAKLQAALAAHEDQYTGRLLWAACCLGFFGFMRCGEFLVTKAGEQPAVLAGDVAVDSHSNPTMLRVFLRRAKCDPFGNGANIYIGVTGSALCPVAAILRYLAVRPPHPGPLMVRKDSSPPHKRGVCASDSRGVVQDGNGRIGVRRPQLPYRGCDHGGPRRYT